MSVILSYRPEFEAGRILGGSRPISPPASLFSFFKARTPQFIQDSGVFTRDANLSLLILVPIKLLTRP